MKQMAMKATQELPCRAMPACTADAIKSANVVELSRSSEMAIGTGGLRKKVARALARGVTLVEILIVLAIVGMIAGGVAVYAVPKFKEAAIKTSKIDATTLQPIADKYRGEHPGDECPTVQLLKDKREISASSKILDAWDHSYVVECETDETYIRSWGPDGKANTEDDVTVPERRKE